MKGIPIKFRAKSCDTGEYLYSSQVKQHKKNLSQGYMNDEEVYNISQLVGYDAAGNEIYEGDEVIAHDKIYMVELKPKYGLFNDLKFCLKK